MKQEIIQWIRNWYDKTATPDTKAVIGISGGKDSTIVAKLCIEALGKERVLGVFLPYGAQDNLDLSKEICDYLGIKHMTIDIKPMVDNAEQQMKKEYGELSEQAYVNLMPRIRMSMLYMVSQTVKGRVTNNCNLSESVMGFSTQWGDNVGDFAPIRNLTVREVIELGYELGLPEKYVGRVPRDDLNVEIVDGEEKVLTDEDVLGISYEDIDSVIYGECTDKAKIDRVQGAYNWSLFKRRQIASYLPENAKRSQNWY